MEHMRKFRNSLYKEVHDKISELNITTIDELCENEVAVETIKERVWKKNRCAFTSRFLFDVFANHVICDNCGSEKMSDEPCLTPNCDIKYDEINIKSDNTIEDSHWAESREY